MPISLLHLSTSSTRSGSVDMVIVTGTNSDSLLVFNPATEVHDCPVAVSARRVHPRLDGRIDDANAG